MSSELQKIKENIDKALKVRLKALKNMGIIKTVSVTKVDILKARGRVQGEIARSANPNKDLFPGNIHFKCCHQCPAFTGADRDPGCSDIQQVY